MLRPVSSPLSIEGMDHCIARRQLLDPEIRSWLGGKPGGKPSASARAAQ